MAVILDVGQLGGMIQVTAEFSNAVLVAMLPQVTDVAKKLEVPVPTPITQQHIAWSSVTPYVYRDGEMAGWGVGLDGGYTFGFHWGHFDSFSSAHAYYALQDPADIPTFFGKVQMTRDEAVKMARDALVKLGIPLEAVFAEQEPRVTPPPVIRKTNTVPHFRVEWIDPRADHHAVDVEVNAEAKRIERIVISPNENLRRPWPKFEAAAVIKRKRLSANPEYAWQLLPIVLRAVDQYAGALGLPVPRPLSSNHVARFEVADNGGWPHSEVEMTNGWRFVYRNSMVNGFYAPDSFFDNDRRPIRVKDFTGKCRLSEAQAVTLIKRALAKLKYPADFVQMGFKPRIVKPTLPGIARWCFWWHAGNEQQGDLSSKVEGEVDMDKGEIKSLYFDNIAFWNKPPAIDVPITPPQPGGRLEPRQDAAR